MMMPVHFFRLDVIDFVLRYDSGFNADGCGRCLPFSRDRRKRGGLRDCGQHYAGRHKSHREFQKVPAFHDFSPFLEMERGQTVSPPQDECSLNSSTVLTSGAKKCSRTRAEHFRAIGASVLAR
jgi:hypothetical protein